MLYADVVVDISAKALDRPFQYKIPEGMYEHTCVGARVSIPFGQGNRLIEGYIINITDKPSFDENKIKEISQVITNSLPAESRLLQLAYWIRQTTGSTLNDAIKAVMPVKMQIKKKEKKVIKVLYDKPNLENFISECQKHNYKAQVAFLNAVINEMPLNENKDFTIDLNNIKNKYSLMAPPLPALEKKGIIKVFNEETFRNPYKGLAITQPNETLNPPQKYIVDSINEFYNKKDLTPCLIHGVTGSGKTFVYINIIRNVIESGRQVIVLIPEIALTYQTIKRFYAAFGDRCSVMHSKLSTGERFDQFTRAKNGQLDIMIGPRSALFTPFDKLGMIVIDEEHETSYQNEYSPKYHARTVAEHIASEAGALLVMGSATPSVESYYKAQKGIYRLFEMKSRAVEKAVMPQVDIVDMRKELEKHNRSIFSDLLRERIKEKLEKKEQIMLFLNRRGYSGFVSCRQCGTAMNCPHCSVSLSAHMSNGKINRLICHYCGYEIPMPEKCPECGSKYIGTFGIGTQKVTKMVSDSFPGARVIRMDADTTKNKGGHENILKCFENGEADILVGTQMIVKGHDFANVTLVGILAADLSLNVGDYTSAERTFELLVQASGRAGRGEKKGDVVIQTYQPEHFAIVAAAANDYDGFYRHEILNRTVLQYPPISHILEVLVTSSDEGKALELGNVLANAYRKYEGINVLGPAPATVSKINDIYRFVIYCKSKAVIRKDIQQKDLNEQEKDAAEFDNINGKELNDNPYIRLQKFTEKYMDEHEKFRGCAIQYESR